ncbi:MAG: methylated-DNA--[protein]-cysteine S-methyltransferase [Flaviaesturariibacter sp.]|nr:methylated-DNA--[protein]-cysteine S-methyltransferase [Flaviaesturariibacter sp.]
MTWYCSPLIGRSHPDKKSVDMIAYHTNPLGILQLEAADDQVRSIRFVEEKTGPCSETPSLVLLECLSQLDAYFAGSLRAFDFPMHQPGTPFQQRVWQGLLGIPYGRTVSYLQLSKTLGDAKAIRAVGTANGRNNLAIVVPCHRVIGSDQALTGYAGGLWRKQWLLDHEARHANGVRTLF